VITLTSGTTYGYDNEGRKICTGSQMGRRNELPAHPETRDIKLHLVRLRLVDGCYDNQGAYWGGPDNLFYASARFHCEILDDWCVCRVFVRARTRNAAKRKVRKFLPKARFFR